MKYVLRHVRKKKGEATASNGAVDVSFSSFIYQLQELNSDNFAVLTGTGIGRMYTVVLYPI
jgi:hypothetical protein